MKTLLARPSSRCSLVRRPGVRGRDAHHRLELRVRPDGRGPAPGDRRRPARRLQAVHAAPASAPGAAAGRHERQAGAPTKGAAAEVLLLGTIRPWQPRWQVTYRGAALARLRTQHAAAPEEGPLPSTSDLHGRPVVGDRRRRQATAPSRVLAALEPTPRASSCIPLGPARRSRTAIRPRSGGRGAAPRRRRGTPSRRSRRRRRRSRSTPHSRSRPATSAARYASRTMLATHATANTSDGPSFEKPSDCLSASAHTVSNKPATTRTSQAIETHLQDEIGQQVRVVFADRVRRASRPVLQRRL